MKGSILTVEVPSNVSWISPKNVLEHWLLFFAEEPFQSWLLWKCQQSFFCVEINEAANEYNCLTVNKNRNQNKPHVHVTFFTHSLPSLNMFLFFLLCIFFKHIQHFVPTFSTFFYTFSTFCTLSQLFKEITTYLFLS